MNIEKAIIIIISLLLLYFLFFNSNQYFFEFLERSGWISTIVIVGGILSAGFSLIYRRIRILMNRKIYQDNAESVEPTINSTLISILKGMGYIWIIFMVLLVFRIFGEYAHGYNF